MKRLVTLFLSVFLPAVYTAGATIDTSPATKSVGTFGVQAVLGTPLYGWGFTVPAVSTQLDSVQFWLNGQQSLSYTANVCLFIGTACAGAALWSSGTLTGTGTGNLDPVTVNPVLGVSPGQSLLFYLLASGGQGTGQLGVNGPGDDTVGNSFFFQNGINPLSAWTGGFLDGSPVAAIEMFSTSGGGGSDGCKTSVACDNGGNTPEPATWALFLAGIAGIVLKRRI